MKVGAEEQVLEELEKQVLEELESAKASNVGYYCHFQAKQ